MGRFMVLLSHPPRKKQGLGVGLCPHPPLGKPRKQNWWRGQATWPKGALASLDPT